MEPISIDVARRDLRIALSGAAGMNTILDLTVDGTVYPAIVKDMQRHPVRRTVQHVDFIQIDLSEEITVSVRIRLEGEAKQVAVAGKQFDRQPPVEGGRPQRRLNGLAICRCHFLQGQGGFGPLPGMPAGTSPVGAKGSQTDAAGNVDRFSSGGASEGRAEGEHEC